MGFWSKNRKAVDQSSANSTPFPANSSSNLNSDPKLVRVFDEFGRELFISKEEWRRNVLPRTLKSNWNNPEQLYRVIVGSLNDQFFADVVAAAEHLSHIDPNLARGACTFGFVLMKNGRLDEAEKVFSTYTQKHGEEGYILTNLAKIFSARDERQKAEDTLWHALELDPNQENGLGWYMAIHRERAGQEAQLGALRRVASLSGSWRAQLWLARAALESSDLSKALAYYRESLSRSGDNVPADVMTQISGDLGRSGHLAELLQLTEPLFVPERHGLLVGNNLIKAHLDLGQVEAAHRILDQLYALKRPDYKQQLGFWDTEIAKARVAKVDPPKGPDLSIEMGTVEGPVWLSPSSPVARLFPEKSVDAPTICFLGFSAEIPQKSEHPQFQIANTPGRFSRALPLFLAEHVWLKSDARVETLVPRMPESGAFVLSGVPWPDMDAANYSLRGPLKSDFVTLVHLKCSTEPWIVEVRLVRSSDSTCIGELTATFQSASPQDILPDLSQKLLALLSENANVNTSRAARFSNVPAGLNFPYYLLRLEQLLAVRAAAMCAPGQPFLSGERDIIDGTLQLCVACPENALARIVFAQMLLSMKKVHPGVVNEFNEKIRLLQQKKALPDPIHSVLEAMFNEALAN